MTEEAILLTYVCTGVGIVLTSVILGLMPGLREEENPLVFGGLCFISIALWPFIAVLLLLYIIGLTMAWLIEHYDSLN